MKPCFICNLFLPLFCFKKVPKGYFSIPNQKSRNFICRLCFIKRAFKDKGYLQKNNKARFDWINATKLQIIKQAIK